MPLHGSTIPTDHGEYVTTVICPNHYSHQRLMQALQSIVPEAAEPGPHHAIEAPLPPFVTLDDDGVPVCKTGACE